MWVFIVVALIGTPDEQSWWWSAATQTACLERRTEIVREIRSNGYKHLTITSCTQLRSPMQEKAA